MNVLSSVRSVVVVSITVVGETVVGVVAKPMLAWLLNDENVPLMYMIDFLRFGVSCAIQIKEKRFLFWSLNG